MFESTIEVLLVLLAAYLAVGAVFAALFHARGIAEVDSAVHGAKWGFRVLVTPGLIALWPLMWKRWSQGDGHAWLGSPDRPVAPEALRRRHGRLIIVVLFVVLVIAIPALVLRPGDPVQPGSLQQLMRRGN